MRPIRVAVIHPVTRDPASTSKLKFLQELADANKWSVDLPVFGRASDIFDLDQRLSSLRNANLVIADVSFESPSCYYEIGLAEALGRPVRLVAQKGTRVFQTASRSTFLEYEHLDDYRTVICRLLAEAAA